MRLLLTISFLLGLLSLRAQTLGGTAAYPFLRLPSVPLLTAAGGVNTSYVTRDAGLAQQNPSLLLPEAHGDLGLSFNQFFAGIRSYSLSSVLHAERSKTTFGAHVFILDYGSVPQTDAAGNREGVFRPVDFLFQVSASRAYLQNWRYGITAKYIRSDYGQYRSSALAFDAGVLFRDTGRLLSASVLVKNAGLPLTHFTSEGEELPFDLQAGITKKLQHAPIGFSLTGQYLHRFDIQYRDTVFNNENNRTSNASFAGRLFNHVVLATHMYAGPHLEAMVGFNHLRRSELAAASGGGGLSGFSAGVRARFRKMEVQYSRAYYSAGQAYNQFGLNLHLNEWPGLK